MKNNNRGMTLIEMIVAFAILGLVSASIFSVLLTGTKTYTKLTTVVKLQQQAQVSASNIERQLINCNEGVTYRSTADGADLYLLTKNASGGIDLKVIRFIKSAGELYLGTQTSVATDGSSISLPFHLLAENVDDMSVSLDGGSGEVDRVSLTLKFMKKDINGDEVRQTVEKTIALRNHPKSTYHCSLSGSGASITTP